MFSYEPRDELRILNWYLYTYGLSGVAMISAGSWAGMGAERFKTRRIPDWLQSLGVITLFALVNIEIADYYSTGLDITWRLATATEAENLTFTIGWLLFGLGLLGSGIFAKSHGARIAAISLIAVTTFKCFLFDLRTLEGLYRIGSFVGLAMSLALVSVVLQKFVLAPARQNNSAAE